MNKKFSILFKILNFISGDKLRNYLAVGVALNLHEALNELKSIELKDYKQLNGSKIRVGIALLEKADANLNDIWHI